MSGRPIGGRSILLPASASVHSAVLVHHRGSGDEFATPFRASAVSFRAQICAKARVGGLLRGTDKRKTHVQACERVRQMVFTCF